MRRDGTEGEENANLDGDFKALCALQKQWKVEALDGEPRDPATSPSAGNFRRLANELRNVSSGEKELRNEKLFQLVEADELEQLEQLVRSAGESRISVAKICRPPDGQNLLHRALATSADKVARFLIEKASVDCLQASFTVTVKNVSSQKTSLHLLAESGNVALAELLLDKVVAESPNWPRFVKQTVLTELDGQRPRGLPALQIAALHGRTRLLELFVGKLQLDVNETNVKGDTAILWSSRANHLQTTKWLIDHAADLSLQNDKGSTPLYWAVRYGLSEMVDLLIEHGKADVNQTRKLGLVAPLVVASAFGYEAIAAKLLRAGADVDKTISGGFRALHHAAAQGHAELARLLLDNHAEIDAANDAGDTALLLAAHSERPSLLRLLVERGADPNRRNKTGTGVWDDILRAKTDMLPVWISCVLESQGDLEVAGQKSALHIAAELGATDKLDRLLQLGADARTVDAAGNTFLHVAARDDIHSVVGKFVDSVGANLQNADGDTALHVAVRYGHGRSMRALLGKTRLELRNGLGETPLHVACKSTEVKVEDVQHLVDTIIKTMSWELVESRDLAGNTALHLAGKSGRGDLVASLRSVNPRMTNRHGDSALHTAVKHQHHEVLRALLTIFRQNLPIDDRNLAGRSALNEAGSLGDATAVNELAKAGADLASQDSQGNTLLHSLVGHKRSSAIFDVIAQKTIVSWWCRKQDAHLPDVETDSYHSYRQEAFIYLLREISNRDGHNVLCLAAKKADAGLLRKMFSLPKVFLLESDEETGRRVYDVTGLTPQTQMGRRTGTKKSQVHDASQAQADENCLDLIVTNKNIFASNELLDIEPLRQLVADYWRTYQWMYVLLMVVHVGCMILISVRSVALLRESLTTGASVSSRRQIWPPVLLLLWPVAIIAFEIFYVASVCASDGTSTASGRPDKRSVTSSTSTTLQDHGGGWKDLLQQHISDIFSLVFSVLMITWFILYVIGNTFQGYVLSVALLLGWLFTIHFTSGIESMHVFSIILRNIVIRNLTRFAVLFAIAMVAFGFAFQALFQMTTSLGQVVYPTIWDVFFLIFNLMLGMAELFDDDFHQAWQQVDRSPFFAKLVYVAYISFTTIILLNVLIAMMTDTYAAVRSREESTWRVGSLLLALRIERSMPFIMKLLRRFRISSKSRPEVDGQTGRWKLCLLEEATFESRQNVRSLNFLSKQISKLSSDVRQLQALMEKHADNAIATPD